MHGIPYALPGDDWSALLDRLAAAGHRGAIVGAHGSGKTTLLGEVTARLAQRGFRIRRVTLTQDRRRLSSGDWRHLTTGLSDRDLICVDGADELSAPHWLVLRLRVHRAGGLLMTSHRAGRLSTLIRCTTSPDLLATIVTRLTTDPAEACRRSALPPLPSAPELFARHAGDIRGALRELYDRCASPVA